jgi:hypothetical protein
MKLAKKKSMKFTEEIAQGSAISNGLSRAMKKFKTQYQFGLFGERTNKTPEI